MKQLTSLVWKEWRETQAYLWIGLGIFLGLPAIGGFEDLIGRSSSPFEIFTTQWVIYFGGVLAIFVAIGSTCRDLKVGLEDFWRSRPVSATSWLLAKYLVGLAVVLVACMTPLAVERSMTWSPNDVVPVLAFYPFQWTAVYSLAFAAGCLLRRPAHAAMVGMIALLLISLLPIILPPLEGLNLTSMQYESGKPLWGMQQVGFASTMLMIAATATILAIIAVSVGWQIASGVRMIYGSIAAVFLILCGSAAFQLGTYLPILQQIELPKLAWIQELDFEKTTGGLWCRMPVDQKWELFHYDIQVNGSLINLANKTTNFGSFPRPHEVLPDGTQIYYTLMTIHKGNGEVKELVAVQCAADHHLLPNVTIPLQPWDDRLKQGPHFYALRNRLYITQSDWQKRSTRIAVLDITTPLTPQLISDDTFGSADSEQQSYYNSDELYLHFPPIAGLSMRERLDLEMSIRFLGPFEGDTLVRSADTLSSYHLKSLTQSSAIFEKTSTAKSTIVDRVFGVTMNLRDNFGILKDGLLYTGRQFSHALSPTIDVYDTTSMKIVSHFAAPGLSAFRLLPDGRALIGAGNKLFVVGRPKTSH